MQAAVNLTNNNDVNLPGNIQPATCAIVALLLVGTQQLSD